LAVFPRCSLLTFRFRYDRRSRLEKQPTDLRRKACYFGDRTPVFAMIHPTAVIDSEAQLDAEVNVGPYALIEGPAQIASGTDIQGHAVITGPVRIGKNNRIGYGAIIGSFPQDLSFDPRVSSGVEIGDNNVIREYCTIHRGTKEGSNTFVGSNNFLMVGSHLGHNARVADNVILANNTLLGGYAEVHDRAFIGGGSIVHQFTRIGAISLLQGGTGIGKDVPPFSIAVGKNGIATINVIGLRRAGFGPDLRKEAKSAFELLYRSGLNAKQALEEAEKRRWAPEIETFWKFVAASKRGICPMVRWRELKSDLAGE
jgi:UDP-N-acetylglucosamine acyltransferase